MTGKKQIEFFIHPEKEGEYMTIPFQMPPDTETLSLSYHYPTHKNENQPISGGTFTARKRINIIDLGLIGPDGKQVGASGSNKSSITLSATTATPGYTPCPLTTGEWQILIGAYQIAPQGVTVSYELRFTQKQQKLLLGDIHTHTIVSDGILSIAELAAHAQQHGLNFLAVTDHNQMIGADAHSQTSGVTIIPGLEWTHFKGHANFLGIEHPYDEPFFTNDFKDVKHRFVSARDRGALIVINHPFSEHEPFHFDLTQLPFDCLEIWNGPMRESNLRAVGYWQTLLESGQKVKAVGGSDYHRDNLFQILGGPCMGVYAMSNSPTDILSALRAGHSFITFAPQGPTLEMAAGEAILGDTVMWHQDIEIQLTAHNLQKGDVVRVISGSENLDLFQAPSEGKVNLVHRVSSPGFIRAEIHRNFLPGLPALPALISNPIFFAGSPEST
jgi:hypothetical protein